MCWGRGMPNPTFYSHMHRDLGNNRFVVLHTLYYEDSNTPHEASFIVGIGEAGPHGVMITEPEHAWTVRASQLGIGELRGVGVPTDIATDLIHEARRWFTLRHLREGSPS